MRVLLLREIEREREKVANKSFIFGYFLLGDQYKRSPNRFTYILRPVVDVFTNEMTTTAAVAAVAAKLFHADELKSHTSCVRAFTAVCVYVCICKERAGKTHEGTG